MTIRTSIINGLSNKGFTYATKGIMGAVVFTTLLKATGRPAFTLMDKKADKESKKFSAANEFLYQLLCLGLTLLMVKPIQKTFFNATKKLLHKIPNFKELEKIKTFHDFEEIGKDIDEFTQKAKEILGTNKTGLNDETAKKQFYTVKGAVEVGSFIGSIVGLTIIAPWLSHIVLHPIMHAIGMNKKENNIGQPTQPYLADAKVPVEDKTKRVDLKA